SDDLGPRVTLAAGALSGCSRDFISGIVHRLAASSFRQLRITIRKDSSNSLGSTGSCCLIASQVGLCRVRTSASVIPSAQTSVAGEIFPIFASGGSLTLGAPTPSLIAEIESLDSFT